MRSRLTPRRGILLLTLPALAAAALTGSASSETGPTTTQRGKLTASPAFGAVGALVRAAVQPQRVAAPGGVQTTSQTNDEFAEMARFDQCHDQVNFMPARMDVARMKVPADYTLKTRETGTEASLVVSELRCDVTVGDTRLPGPVSMAVGVFEVTGAPEGTPDDPATTDFYLLFWATDSEGLADWLRAGTGLTAYYVPGIVYDYTIPEPVGVAPFRFHAPGPPDWAFTVEGAAGAQHLASIAITEDWWQDTKTPDGTTWRVKLAVLEHADYVAPADVTFTAASGSELERIMVSNPAGTAGGEFLSVRIDHWDLVKTRTVIGSPTAVTVRSLQARASGGSVVLRWRMETEIGLVGFNVYRERLGRRIKLNRVLIAATPSASRAGRYSWRDRHPARGAQYFLEELRHDGERVWHGPVAPAVAAAAGGVLKGGRR